MRTKMPIWVNFFTASVTMLFVVVLTVTMFLIHQMISKENTVLDSNISSNIYYSNLNLKNSLNRYKEQFGSISMALRLCKQGENDEQYRAKVWDCLSSIYSETSEVIAVFYHDAEGNYFSVGEVFQDINSQINIIHECKSKEEYSRGDGLWRYAIAGRGYNSVALCKDIVYVDDNYMQTECGTLLLYLDSNKLSVDFFDETSGNGVIVCDPYGVIAISQDKKLIGKKYDEVFVSNGDSVVKDGMNYLVSKNSSDINGWSIISYIDENVTGKQLSGTLIRIIVIALIGLALLGWISYMMSKKVGKPIEELISYIKVNQYGQVAELPDQESYSDIAEIKKVFQAMSSDLRKNIEANYEMQLKLKDITIKAYESQMNPHFLFNTLQMIQMMNVLGKTEAVTEITNCLGRLLRFNLNAQNEVKLSEEVENVVNYLKILELRFKGQFNYKIMIPEELMECYTAKFTMQPIIENAVNHGFSQKKDKCEVAIMAQVINGEIAIVIKDNGKGIPPNKLEEIKRTLRDGRKKRGEGIGITNVNERIKFIYGKSYGIDIFSNYTKSTHVVIHIPMCKTPQNKEDEYVQISNH